MRSETEVLDQVTAWAQNNHNVRAAVLIGSRSNPKSKLDFLSDYDINLYVTNSGLFLDNDSWLNNFGSILVRWPMHPRSTFDENWLTRLALFDDGVRIDFQITGIAEINQQTIDYGYRTLVDKDELTKSLKQPTFSSHNIKQPSEKEYLTLVHEFWWDATYVPKYLLRDELPFANHMLDCELRCAYLHKMLEWHIGMQNNWRTSAGVHGARFKKFLDPELWRMYQSIFSNSSIEETWRAFFNLIRLFRHFSREVGAELGFDYPKELDEKVSNYIASLKISE